jgi:hypothetical protein
LTEATEIIKANTRKQREGYFEEETSYAEISKYFDNFLKMLPVKIDFKLSKKPENIMIFSKEKEKKLK